MGKGKKPFIDRKKAVTFQLVHRSQHDPLVADETAPQRVLVESGARQPTKVKTTDPVELAKRRQEQLKYGINFDDDYDYLQHLKQPEQDVVWEYVENPNQARKRLETGKVTTAPKLQLPSSVFASEFEEDVGMLNKAAPQPGPHPEWDPDVVAALDNDFDYDNENNLLDDDFMLKAMGEGPDSDEEQSEEEEEDEEDKSYDSDNLLDTDEDEMELMDRLAPLLRERRFDDEETRSRFTEYSMSSSVIRRNEQLTLLDDRFEQFYANYDDPELGDLGGEDIEGTWHQKHPYIIGCWKEFKKNKKTEEYNKEWDKERLEKYRFVQEDEENANEAAMDVDNEVEKPKKWDCESIISTYSTAYNHPKIIDEPKRSRRSSTNSATPAVEKIEIDPKTGLPVNILRGGPTNLTTKALSKLTEDTAASGPKSVCAKSVISTLSVLSLRPTDETPEEKRERKRLLKEYRNERRIERKANTAAFKEEKKRQTHVKINKITNQQGIKIV